MPESDAPAALAVGWASVDLDRAALELAGALAPGTGFAPAPDCIHLGARCLVGPARDASTAGAPLVILLEPTTEGRLAATLARHGEGWCATWVAGDPDGVIDDGEGDSGRHTSVRPGPLGPERLLPGGPIHGPHRLLVRAATIDG